MYHGKLLPQRCYLNSHILGLQVQTSVNTKQGQLKEEKDYPERKCTHTGGQDIQGGVLFYSKYDVYSEKNMWINPIK